MPIVSAIELAAPHASAARPSPSTLGAHSHFMQGSAQRPHLQQAHPTTALCPFLLLQFPSECLSLPDIMYQFSHLFVFSLPPQNVSSKRAEILFWLFNYYYYIPSLAPNNAWHIVDAQ